MSNMSHCRFTNTLADLEDCFEHLEDPIESSEEGAQDHGEPMISEAEASGRDMLIELCTRIAQDYGDIDEWKVSLAQNAIRKTRLSKT